MDCVEKALESVKQLIPVTNLILTKMGKVLAGNGAADPGRNDVNIPQPRVVQFGRNRPNRGPGQ